MIRNKKGSSMVLLSMVFVTFAMCIASTIAISRKLVIKSECEAFGLVWTRAVLGEYDINLLRDYGIQAYWGLDCDVEKKLNHYSDYSLKGKMSIGNVDIIVDLMNSELSNPDNFRTAVKKSGLTAAAGTLMNDKRRVLIKDVDDDRWGHRIIRNKGVIASLPSKGIKNKFDVELIKNSIKSIKDKDDITGIFSGCAYDLAFMYRYMGSHNERLAGKETLLRNEWEYVVTGSYDDNGNYKAAKNKIRLIRNAMNLIYLYSNPEKRELITATSEAITPGPAAAATAILISEAWSLIETKYDMDTLENNGRVPVIKNEHTWKTSIKSALKSEKVRDALDEEGKKLLGKNLNDIDEEGSSATGSVEEGLTYENYLMILVASLDRNIRTLRIMDIVTINMKYRHYEDFNMDEYHTSIDYSIKADGKQYEFDDEYK